MGILAVSTWTTTPCMCSEPRPIVQQASAAVLCDDRERLEGWREVLSTSFDPIWLSTDCIAWTRNGADAPRPVAVDALFLHADEPLLAEDLGSQFAKESFVFNEPGTPRATGPYRPIRKPAPAAVKLTPQEVQEIADFVLGDGPVPSCCFPPTRDTLAPALLLLCQGYIFAHTLADRRGREIPPGIREASPESAPPSDFTAILAQEATVGKLSRLLHVGTPQELARLLVERVSAGDYWRAVAKALEEAEGGGPERVDDPQLPEAARKLLELIPNENRETIDVDIVTAAYAGLARHLRGRR